MKEYLFDIIPKIQKHSKKLDNITILANQHWVLFQENSNDKIVYIFRPDNELLLSENGKVKKAKWEYVGDFSILIDFVDNSFLLKHGFFDDKILIMKMDGQSDFSIFLNESKIGFELDSNLQIENFIKENYLKEDITSSTKKTFSQNNEHRSSTVPKVKIWKKYITAKGEVSVEIFPENKFPWTGDKVLLNNAHAPDGKYKLGAFEYIKVKNGVILEKHLI